MISRLVPRAPLALAALLALAACDDYGLGPDDLYSGRYDYAAWSDFDRREPAWWGTLDLEVDDYNGTVYGSYRLPDQCEDRFGRLIDCRGTVDGRVYRDGTIRFELDDGWLTNRGRLRSGSRAEGDWDAVLPGYRDEGEFELVPY